MDYSKAFFAMGITSREYIKKYALPVVALGAMFPILITIILGDLVPSLVKTVLYLIPVALVFLMTMYPMTFLEGKK